MTISYTHELPLGHRLQNHEGGCKFLHGHNYLITIQVGANLDERGMVMDFHELKQLVRKFFEVWDHAFVLEEGDPALAAIQAFSKWVIIPHPPTAEILANWWAMHFAKLLPEGIYLDCIIVNETKDCQVRA